MIEIADRYIATPDLSHAWLEAVRMLGQTPDAKAVHLVLRVADPTAEDLRIRQAAQALIDRRNARGGRELPDIETTRNTIFPAAWARRNPEPADLAAYYRERYTREGLLGFNQNNRGTYFGRIVAYPRSDGESADQLTDTVRKLRAEIASGSNKSSRYEINIYNEREDTSPMSFPCLAHLSLHLHERRLHLQAIYRNEYIVGRAYGNYLGLAQLQIYIAEQTATDPGELLMTLGHVELESGNKRAVRQMLEDLSC
jgi:thymidylate synthase